LKKAIDAFFKHRASDASLDGIVGLPQLLRKIFQC
jgi:hypothetical protein